ncbi:alpha/beta hydrolase [Amycolatopsis samaneae]|uniref:Alpha/beta hydrolase n=1 Tax=Amycolatopsis samaneae TaxID=664691 RepID=A0ABW5GNT1_9PSEU
MTSAPTAGGYRVVPARLDQVAGELGGQADALATAQSTVAGERLPAAAFGELAGSAAAAAAFTKTTTGIADRLGKKVDRIRSVQTGLTGSAAGYRRLDTRVAAMYRALLPEDPLPAAGRPAGAGGGADTGAWAGEITRNRAKVADALTGERKHLAGLLAHGGEAEDIARARRRIALYEDILAHNRQILRFDPAGDGRIAELIGHLEPGTHSVGVFVPGTNTRLDNFDGYAGLGRSLVAADPAGRTAMVVWADGVFPQGVVAEAPDSAYSRAQAPDLKAFTDELRGQIASHAGRDVMVTAIGHSYGGATVGLAEGLGLDVDRVLHVESAGMGHGIWSPADLPPSQAGVQRYSMTAPFDPIVLAQGNAGVAEWLGSDLGHGADPDTFPGVTELDTGRDAHGDVLWGLSAHNDVLKPGSDSWQNIYDVITGGTVTPEGSSAPRGFGERGFAGPNTLRTIP